MDAPFACSVMSEAQADEVWRSALRILAEIGVVVENRELLDRLAAFGASVDPAGERARFPSTLVERFVADSSAEYEEIDGAGASCLFPSASRKRLGLEVTAGTYPQYLLTPEGAVVPHTLASAAEMTRLGDALGNIDRLGAMGIPSDVPPGLTPLHMRLIAWKHARRTPSGCGEVRDPALIPYILELGRIAADARGWTLRECAFAEVELISPLRFARVEARIFEEFRAAGLLAGIGFMHSAGGSSPATLAGTLSLDLAESLFVNVVYRVSYGWRKLWFMTNSSVLDMKAGFFPFGRPERGLLALAMGQLARRAGAGLWASAVYPDAKSPGAEAGMQSAFNAVPAVIAGTTGIECFGLLSGAEMSSPVQLVIDDEFAGALKRFARGLAVDGERLAFDVIAEAGPGGFFAGTDHTVAHYREEHWQPRLFSREGLNAWLAGDRKDAVEKARDRAADILRAPAEPALPEDAERRMLAVIERAGAAAGR